MLSEGEVSQSYPTLCNPVDCSLPGFSIHGILQARILEWVTISFSRGSSWPRDGTQVSLIGGRCFNLWATREACWVAQLCLTLLWLHGLQPSRLLCPWDCPGKNTGVGCRFFLQEIFVTKGLNQCLLHCRRIVYHCTSRDYKKPVSKVLVSLYIPTSSMEEFQSLYIFN